MKTVKNQFMTMLNLQDEMNSIVNPEWRQQKYEWYRAIWIEASEMLDHFGWKWWKKQEPDLPQVHLELVDIWHFGLSKLLENFKTHDEAAVYLNYVFDAAMLSVQDDNSVREKIEQFACETLYTHNFNALYFFCLMRTLKLSFDDLYTMYVGKNMLNIFRQNHGYKDGTYIKVWDGKEDNEHLVDVLNSVDKNDRDYTNKVYEKLENIYPN